MSYNIVLIEPEIPNNTGNIGRLSLATGSTLHLVKPFGFELNDTRVKRAGLDYWQHVELKIYESTEAFFSVHKNKSMAFFSSHGTRDYWDIPFKDEMFLIFGKESVGLPKDLISKHETDLYKIPIHSPHIRSINLANAVGVVVYEGLRQAAMKC
ncbi:tRNA (cytidine/uridine-2'-O-)-methyltransferase [Ulvibacter sp. MAR_2010_11]|uniref:tRNA (cytidine(34)-2'-O)-methyltransferase n=1 Tax=Ulvibacter sp. MAR_2010_11 TaxID=1250229 RepID=UPI000C2BAD9A|nr:tRNA (cytidine(34)-2'-O)-methyltransferase [Ulvibacter sp. MAR_2010_11]PKA83711.1 tRNA (cytidine/uridine-2'-O-)-methyltransferase [Ulvibacter sp. MAR_2010_11]